MSSLAEVVSQYAILSKGSLVLPFIQALPACPMKARSGNRLSILLQPDMNTLPSSKCILRRSQDISGWKGEG